MAFTMHARGTAVLVAVLAGAAGADGASPTPSPPAAAPVPRVARRVAPLGRTDPYTQFRYVLLHDGRPVAGFRSVTGVGGAAHGIVARRAGAPTAAPPTVTLVHGVSHDPDFESWAASALGGAPPGAPLPRRDLVLEAFDEAGRLSASYRIEKAVVTQYQAIPDLDAGANSVVIQLMKLASEGVASLPH